MISGQEPHASRASSRHVRVAGGIRTWVTDLLFWFLFITDVFAACYWPISRLGSLLVESKTLTLNTARVVVLLLSALLTPAVTRSIILLLKRRG